MEKSQISFYCIAHSDAVVNLEFSDIVKNIFFDGYYLISACKDGSATFRKGNTGEKMITLRGHEGPVWCVDINRDATLAASASSDCTGKIWDSYSGRELFSVTQPEIVRTAHFAKKRDILVTGGDDQLIRIFDLTELHNINTFKGHTSAIRNVHFFKDDSQLISSSDDNTLKVWDRRTNDEIKTIEFTSPANSIEISHDDSIITVTYSNSVLFFDTQTMSLVREYPFSAAINSASLHPNKRLFICGGNDCIIYKIDYETGEELEANKGHEGPIRCVKFSPDGAVYTSCSDDGYIHFWKTYIE